MSSSEVDDFVDYAKPVIDRSPQMNEETTKARIIQPLLERLGWDITKDIELEFSISMHGRHHSVDYALMIEEKPSLFIEAKGCDTPLDKDHGEQLETYMKQHNVNWGLLTNGKEYRVMFRQTQDGDVHVAQLGSITLEQFPQRVDLWKTLTKESIQKGEAIEIAEHIQEINRIIDELTTIKDDIADTVTKTVTSQIGESISNIVESEAKAFVDNLIDSLEAETKGGVPETPVERTEVRPVVSNFWEEIKREFGIVKEGNTISLPEGKPANATYTDFVEYLVNAGHISEGDVPIESGPTRYILNSEPVDQRGSDMHNPKRINGFYLETHMSSQDIKRRILELGEEFGQG